MAKDHFLQGLQRTLHLKQAQTHVDKPASAESAEDLDAAIKRAELEKTKAEVHYWEERRQANATAGDEPVFGLASNQRKYKKRFPLPPRKRRSWK
jgi:hypothetical protein